MEQPLSSQSNSLTRRSLLAGAMALSAASTVMQGEPTPSGLKVAIFSKHLRFLEGEKLADGAASVGFDGIDLAVRAGGHVDPATVAQDLPKLVSLIRARGLEVPMITTDIVDDTSPHAEDVLRAANGLGIHHYRWGGFKYNDAAPIAEQLDALKPRVAKLAALNKRYNACAMYHTHSGIGVVGAPVWDMHIVLRDFDPNLVAINYDIGHATIEGGFGGWIDSFRVTGAHLKGIAVKDFLWEKDAKGVWKSDFKPLGTGMVHFDQFFEMVKQRKFAGPLQLHFEYPLGGADTGRKTLTLPQEEVLEAMKRDLAQLRVYLNRAGLSA